jgi:riboflavin kinase/FMN adenylyltransferase
MQVLRSIPELAHLREPVVLAIGVFDGVHLGHRAVLERALAEAKEMHGISVAVTFDPHPLRVLRPESAPRLLTSTNHKVRLIRDVGIENLLILPFDAAFANTPPVEFIRELVEHARPLRKICVGHQWSFGRQRAGNLELLASLGVKFGFDEIGVPPVCVDGVIVSSTAIRGAVEVGDFVRAASMLGREFTILGTVKPGDRIGRQLGFPTANLSAHNEQFPPNGVYAVEVHRVAAAGCAELRGVVNIGVRPTIANATGERVLEVHLLDFEGDLYGEDLELTFRQFLRTEQKFGSMEALRAQIAEDVSTARHVLSGTRAVP